MKTGILINFKRLIVYDITGIKLNSFFHFTMDSLKLNSFFAILQKTYNVKVLTKPLKLLKNAIK